ncbi:putative ABC transporter permease [Pseudoflavonifractor sp. CLA-AP-H29]|uniref:ABC transporter permease n=1 Tax=Pseudoflavonifractor intestinihominis TaxID=3133171 RepID=A0ABV1E9K8_9FIRM
MYYTLYQLAWFFLVYSLAGWCVSVAAAAVRRHIFVNSGFLNLPLKPSYGFGAVLFAIFLPELADHPVFLVVGGAVIAAAVTFVTGFLLERIFHRRWWDYTRHRFQFEGYIFFPLLLVWGLLALASIWFLDPLLAGVLDRIPRLAGLIALLVCWGVVAVDFVVSLVSVLQLRFRLRRLARLSENFRDLSDVFGNAITRRVQRRVLRAHELEAEKLLEAQTEREEKRGVFAEGCCFHKLVWLFVIAAFLGDIIETLFCRVTAGVWMSRSSLIYGAFSVVWGLGAVMFTAVLYKYKDRSDRYIFLAGTILGGAYEYACSVFTELAFGTVFWDYSHLPFNLGGRINLLYCFFWGIAAVVWLKGIYPVLSGLIERIPPKIGRIGTWVLIVFMVCNMALSALALARYNQRQTAPDAPTTILSDFLDRHYPDERIAKVYPNAILVEE